MKDKSLAIVALLGSIGFLWQASEMLQKHSAWSDFRTPTGAGEIVFCVLCGLVAVAAALGVDVPSLVKGFRKG